MASFLPSVRRARLPPVTPPSAGPGPSLGGRARFSWAGLAPELDAPLDIEVQIRAHADPVPAVLTLEGGELVVRPTNPLDGVAPGQTAVLYAGTRVLGQFTIDRSVNLALEAAGAS